MKCISLVLFVGLLLVVFPVQAQEPKKDPSAERCINLNPRARPNNTRFLNATKTGDANVGVISTNQVHNSGDTEELSIRITDSKTALDSVRVCFSGSAFPNLSCNP